MQAFGKERLGCSHGCVNLLTHITVISVMIQRMDDPGHESPGIGSGPQLGPSLKVLVPGSVLEAGATGFHGRAEHMNVYTC